MLAFMFVVRMHMTLIGKGHCGVTIESSFLTIIQLMCEWSHRSFPYQEISSFGLSLLFFLPSGSDQRDTINSGRMGLY